MAEQDLWIGPDEYGEEVTQEVEDYLDDIHAKVSRTFDAALDKLSGDLRRQVQIGYLMCRIPDTIEDTSLLDGDEKHELLNEYREVLRNPSYGNLEDFVEKVSETADKSYDELREGDSEEYWDLVQNSKAVMSSFLTLEEEARESITDAVDEMSRGMADFCKYSHESGYDGIRLEDMQEFKVYCHYVAGTVGNMLTDLFVQKDKSLPEQALRKNATDFGKYLQTINILKDPVEDWIEEKAVFIPEKELEKGKTHEDLIGILEYPEWSKGEILMEGMANMLGYAGNKRNDALEYVQEVPDSEIRRYLEVPYLLAVATENLARNEPERALDQELSIDIGKVSKILGFREEGTSFEDIRGELHSEPETVKTDSEIDPEILPKEAFPQPFPPVSRPDPE